MITVISATNREESKTEQVARIYCSLLEEAGGEVQYFTLKDLPDAFLSSSMYDERTPEMDAIINRYFLGAGKLVFIIPEYNGSYPGILKTLLDTIPPPVLRNKKVGIVGVSDGHAGNLRGQEHLTGVLHYLRMFVHYSKPKLSGIDKLLDEEGHVLDVSLIKRLREHAHQMIDF